MTPISISRCSRQQCGWPETEWAMRLLPLLGGEVQITAHGLPAAFRGAYQEMRRALRIIAAASLRPSWGSLTSLSSSGHS